MTTHFDPAASDPHADRYWEELESALMASTLATSTDAGPERKRALLEVWVQGVFNAAAAGLIVAGQGELAWFEIGPRRDLIYRAPSGLTCPLVRVYPQEDGSWAALVVAGVRDDDCAAMARAEWALTRLTA